MVLIQSINLACPANFNADTACFVRWRQISGYPGPQCCYSLRTRSLLFGVWTEYIASVFEKYPLRAPYRFRPQPHYSLWHCKLLMALIALTNDFWIVGIELNPKQLRDVFGTDVCLRVFVCNHFVPGIFKTNLVYTVPDKTLQCFFSCSISCMTDFIHLHNPTPRWNPAVSRRPTGRTVWTLCKIFSKPHE